MRDLVIELCDRITADSQERLKELDLDCPANLQMYIATPTSGPKYTRIRVGMSIRYFIEKSTGKIYAANSYKAPNFNRSFGTLETQDEFNWGNYEAFAKSGSPWKMRTTANGYFTADPIV